jgi:D-methionine transport system ATP-binding protein
VVFDGNSVFEPIISNMTLDCHTAVNILASDTKNIEGRVYGQMVLQLPEDESALTRVKSYLAARNIYFEEEIEDA